MKAEAIRKASEDWAASEARALSIAVSGHNFEYASASTALCWRAWQAATRAAVPAWQPIETAPKGKTVMLFHEENAVPLTGTHGAGDIWVAMVPGVPMPFQPVLRPAPTHWMPLPAAPEVKP